MGVDVLKFYTLADDSHAAASMDISADSLFSTKLACNNEVERPTIANVGAGTKNFFITC